MIARAAIDRMLGVPASAGLTGHAEACTPNRPRLDLPTRRAIGWSASAPLSNKQKAKIAMLARDAFDKHGCKTGMGFDDWRHEQDAIACGKSSLRAATQKDYRSLKAHFNAILGNMRAAFRDIVATGTQDVRVALAALRRECDSDATREVMPDGWNYAAGFLRNKRGVEIGEAAAKDIWHAIYMLRRRCQQLRRKHNSEIH